MPIRVAHSIQRFAQALGLCVSTSLGVEATLTWNAVWGTLFALTLGVALGLFIPNHGRVRRGFAAAPVGRANLTKLAPRPPTAQCY
jgi:hypothetical protein